MFSRNTHLFDLCSSWGKARSAVCLGRLCSYSLRLGSATQHTDFVARKTTNGNSWYKPFGLIGQRMATAKRTRFASKLGISIIPQAYRRSSGKQYCSEAKASRCGAQCSSRAWNLRRHTELHQAALSAQPFPQNQLLRTEQVQNDASVNKVYAGRRGIRGRVHIKALTGEEQEKLWS